MKSYEFSIVVPVYNRPDEMDEFLASWTKQQGTCTFEIIIVEDGSSIDCQAVVAKYQEVLPLRYFYKSNSGPGDSRNFGMRHAQYAYCLIFDSDCVIPPDYLVQVQTELQREYVDFFGGPDAAAAQFNPMQKAVSFAMTSVLTTGGVRGAMRNLSKFQPRSFNMGISKQAFEQSGGFGQIHPGEDPDLVLRLWKLGFSSRLFPLAKVYHKRRISFELFYKQVNKFGKARPILDSWHPEYKKATYAFPALFLIGFVVSLLLAILGYTFFIGCYVFYFVLVFIYALIELKSLQMAWLSMLAVGIQFTGYGRGYLLSFYRLNLLQQSAEQAFPELFFKK